MKVISHHVIKTLDGDRSLDIDAVCGYFDQLYEYTINAASSQQYFNHHAVNLFVLGGAGSGAENEICFTEVKYRHKTKANVSMTNTLQKFLQHITLFFTLLGTCIHTLCFSLCELRTLKTILYREGEIRASSMIS